MCQHSVVEEFCENSTAPTEELALEFNGMAHLTSWGTGFTRYLSVFEKAHAKTLVDPIRSV